MARAEWRHGQMEVERDGHRRLLDLLEEDRAKRPVEMASVAAHRASLKVVCGGVRCEIASVAVTGRDWRWCVVG